MKKKLIPILAILLTLAMIFTLAACGDKPEDPTESDTTTVDDTIDVVVTDPVVDTTEFIDDTTDETSTDEDTTTEADPNATTDPTATTNIDDTTKAPGADPLAPPANLGSLGKAEQLAYFNKVANRVRTDKPGFKTDYLEELGKMSFTGVVSVISPIIEAIKQQAMPGEWKYETIGKGSDNKGKFMSDNANASDLKISDVASITSTKSGNNWIIKVNIIQETNPAKGTGSAHSRVMPIASRQDVLDTITDINDAISADVNDATLKYNSGYATVTVNEKGQVISGEYGFKVDAQANNVSIKVGLTITTNVTAPQSTVKKFHDFVW